MPKTIRIANINFNYNFFQTYMKKNFGESFAHSSLSFEKVFEESKKYALLLEEFSSKKNSEYAIELANGNEEDKKLLEQRFSEVAQVLHHNGMPTRNEIKNDEIDLETETYCIEDFVAYFSGAIRPYRNKREYEQAAASNKLQNKEYEQETLIQKANELFDLIKQKIMSDTEAKNLKRGNNEAFAYALNQGPLTIPDIIEINALVNNETGIRKGFKTSDNDILGSSFTPVKKEFVPIKMQELLYKYSHEWAEEIPTYQEGIDSVEDKEKYLKAICEREAKFHIEFERIHPFEDGNGRTGRIILNKNLIDNELAPILITPQMHDVYISCIGNYDYKRFAQYIYLLSSVSLTEMTSAYRKAKGINPDELGINETGFLNNLKKDINLNLDLTKKN